MKEHFQLQQLRFWEVDVGRDYDGSFFLFLLPTEIFQAFFEDACSLALFTCWLESCFGLVSTLPKATVFSCYVCSPQLSGMNNTGKNAGTSHNIGLLSFPKRDV